MVASDESYAMIATFKVLPSGIVWHAQETKTITGTTNTTTFTVTLPNGDYKWNCMAFDNAGNSAFAPSNLHPHREHNNSPNTLHSQT